jgi:hypothetical protein
VSDDDFDAREWMHTFRLKWGTAGKMPRFIIDGRKYDTSAAVRADIEEAAKALSRLHIPAEIDMTPIGPNDHGPVLPSWREFREGLAALDIEQRSQE